MLKLLELIIFMFSSNHHFMVNSVFGKLFPSNIKTKKGFSLIISPFTKNLLQYSEEEDDT